MGRAERLGVLGCRSPAARWSRAQHQWRGGLVIAAFLSVTPISCRSGAETAATAAAEAWLPVVDAGDYARSWQLAAAYLQHAVADKQWEASLGRTRKPLGRVLSRTRTDAKEAVTALGDRCVIVRFQTVFEHKSSAVETITVMPAAEGQWKVAGYFVT